MDSSNCGGVLEVAQPTIELTNSHSVVMFSIFSKKQIGMRNAPGMHSCSF